MPATMHEFPVVVCWSEQWQHRRNPLQPLLVLAISACCQCISAHI